MRTLFFLGGAIYLVSLFAVTTPAEAETKICVSNRTSAIRLASRCRSSERQIRNLSELQGAQGPEGPSFLVGVARAYPNSWLIAGLVNTYRRGPSTTSVEITDLGGSTMSVVFVGTFAGLTETNSDANRLKVIPVTGDYATMEDYYTRVGVTSATSTRIEVALGTYLRADRSPSDFPAQVAVYLAE